MTSPDAVVTKTDVASWEKEIKKADRPLQIMDAKAKDFAYFKDAHTHFSAQREQLLTRIKSMGTDPNPPKTTDASVKKLTADIATYVKQADQSCKKQHELHYLFGPKQVNNYTALESEIKKVLPQNDQPFVSQAVNDAIKGQAKAANSVEAGMRHASSGTPRKGSCALFFTRDDKQGGLVTELKIHAVANHKGGGADYVVVKSFNAKLKEGNPVRL
jgi:hypothetical protein